MNEQIKSRKFLAGVEDGKAGFPSNRFMREDQEYMAGYNEAINKADSERPDAEGGKG